MAQHLTAAVPSCSNCGSFLNNDLPAGLCPVCLLRLALEDPSEIFTSAVLPDSPAAKHPRDAPLADLTVEESRCTVAPSIPGPAIRPPADSRRPCFGEYELLEEISRGGMGVVYKARQIRLNRRVALKMIRGGKFSSDAEIKRLRGEAESAAQLDHPGIVPVFEIGEHDGLHFFTMAFVDGQPLSSKLIEGPLPATEAARIVLTVSEALQYAHEHGVIHRDMKPGNILIDSSGQPRVSDFGLAKRIATDSSMTVSGEVLGTPSFMPPEQARGDLNQIGPVSDVYAMGAVLYACLTGAPPFRAATSMETLRQVMDLLPISPRQLNPSIPRDLETICLKCLEKQTSHRYPSAVALAEDLRRYLSGHPIAARPVSTIEKLWRWMHRRPDLAISLTAFVVLLGCGMLAVLILQRQHELAEDQVRVQGLVQQIQTAEITETPHLIGLLSAFDDHSLVQDTLDKHLHSTVSVAAKIRLSLARGLVNRHLESDDCLAWLELSLEELAVIGPLTGPLRYQHCRLFEREALSAENSTTRRLRAVCLLFTSRSTEESADISTDEPDLCLDPKILAERIDWELVTSERLQELFENPAEFKAASKLLRPLTSYLKQPLREHIQNVDMPAAHQNIAVSLLGELLQESPREIADLICLVDSRNLSLVTRHVDRLGNALVPALLEEFERPLEDVSAPREDLNDDARIALAEEFCRRKADAAGRQAMAAAWLAYVGSVDQVWPLLQAQPDASVRYALPDRLLTVGIPADPVVDRLMSLLSAGAPNPQSSAELAQSAALSDSRVVSEIHMLILLSSEMTARVADAELRERLSSVLLWLLKIHPNPGIHSACEWSLRKLGAESLLAETLQQLTPSLPADNRDWFITSQGATLAVIRGPVNYQSGSAWSDPDRLAHRIVDPITARVTSTDQEPLLTRIIDRDFAVGLKEVSFAEFLLFDESYHERIKQTTSNTVQHPANRINWYLAAEYCNWLSQQEGIEPSEWCFQPNSEGNYAEGMTLSENYLQRTGYRMPTEAEWEYVCRAGTSTPRFFGHCRELMPQFVWFRDNSREKALIVPGTLKPNDFGLFDVFGNVIEWCIDPYEGRPGPQSGPVFDHERHRVVNAEAWRVLRGGHLYAEDNNIRASDLWTFRPLVADGHYGLRLARTIKDHRAVGTP